MATRSQPESNRAARSTSVVIPVADVARELAGLLNLLSVFEEIGEALVADSGSRDDARAVAEGFGAH